MKTKYLNILSLSLLTWLTACVGDLDTKPIDENVVTAEDVYKNPEAYRQTLAKVYSVFAVSGQIGPDGNPDLATSDEGTSNYLRQLWNMQELTTDEAICAWKISFFSSSDTFRLFSFPSLVSRRYSLATDIR